MITLTEKRRPLGAYTWLAILRDGTNIHEFWDDEPQKSVDGLLGLDVAELHLIAVPDTHRHIIIQAQADETIKKHWTRTFVLNLDDPKGQQEQPIIDAFILESERPVKHLVFANGVMLVTTAFDV